MSSPGPNALDALSPVERTLLIPLWARAAYRGGGFDDPGARALLQRLGVDTSPTAADLGEHGRVALGERARRFDRIAADFFARHPDGLMVNLGGGLDSPEDRLPTGRFLTVELPAVAALRGALLPDTPRSATRAAAAEDRSWIADLVGPTLVIFGGVHMYLPEAYAEALLRDLLANPKTELAFDAYSRPALWLTQAAVRASSLPEAGVVGWTSEGKLRAMAGRRPVRGELITAPPGLSLGWRTRGLFAVARVLRFSTLWTVGPEPSSS